MRILVLIHEYPPIGGGGGHVAQDVARGLVKLGHEVCVLAPHMKNLPLQSVDEGVRLIRIPSFRRKAFVGDMLAMSGYLFIGFFVSLWLIFRFQPQIIHVHFAVPAGLLAWALSKLTGRPYVLTSHLGDVPGGVPEKTDRWFGWIYPFTPRIWQDAAAVTAISDFTRYLALSHYPVEVNVIHNGIEIERSHKENIKVNKPPQIVFAGRFVHQKNPVLIPQVLYALRELDWHCVMIGDGEFHTETMQEIALLGLQDRFTLPGWMSTDAVMKIMKDSDILLMPSLTEGIPLTGLQALANGLAIVSSRVGGMLDLVEDRVNGFLHVPYDVQGFIESMRSLLTDPVLLMNTRKASFEHSRKFDLSYVIQEYERILISALTEER
ncbi:MAG: glycosyltransferase family 4 protein [Anaerolineales bacterium]|nr:glycosyltransferase family 4 protein [Anaerolineales bacterium]